MLDGRGNESVGGRLRPGNEVKRTLMVERAMMARHELVEQVIWIKSRNTAPDVGIRELAS